MMRYYIPLGFISSLIVITLAERCPPKEIIAPCICQQQNPQVLPDLTCNSQNFGMDMGAVLKNINDNWEKGVKIFFGQLRWTNGKVIEMKNAFFGNVSFEHINIGSEQYDASVVRIHPNAFLGTADRVKTITISSEYLKNEDDLFSALSTLTVIKSIKIMGRFKTIPEKAFQTPSSCLPLTLCVQSELESIVFRFGLFKNKIFLEEIKSHAFYDLPNLTILNFEGQNITHISKEAFAFRNKSDKLLNVSLCSQYSELNSSSFEIGSLENTNRPIKLDLTGNWKFGFLDKKIFQPFLDADARNIIKLGGDGIIMNCGCEMYWLKKGEDKYKKQFEVFWNGGGDTNHGYYTIMCSDGLVNFWDRTQEDFKNCK